MKPADSQAGRPRLSLALRRRSALPLIAVASCLLVACGEPAGDSFDEERRLCTLIGCSSSLWIALPANPPPGEWTIEIDADGMSWTCTATAPLATDDDAACSGFDVEPRINHAGAWGISLWWAPETVAVRLYHEEELVDEVSQAPDYEENYPNGKACDRWPCLTGSVQLHLGAR